MRLLHVLATAYCLTGTTASGHGVHPGSIAVDPRLIPLGSHLYVPGYGRGHADDTGGAILGHRIDVWFRSCARARWWGRRWLTVRVRRP